jgi:hypothetical protein
MKEELAMGMGDLRRKIETWMAAVAFAEAGDHRTALEIVAGQRRKKVEIRKPSRKRNRMELRPSAPGA